MFGERRFGDDYTAYLDAALLCIWGLHSPEQGCIIGGGTRRTKRLCHTHGNDCHSTVGFLDQLAEGDR